MSLLKRSNLHVNVGSTQRIEAFSDGIFAFNATLLVLELHVPELTNGTLQTFLDALMNMGPKFLGFVISFITIAIFWVNHHHFFHNFNRADWKLLWFNNMLLFFITLMPFTTAFIGDYPKNPAVVALYALVMWFATFSFALTIRHVFFKSKLMDDDIPLADRKKEFNRIWPAIITYGIATVIAPFYVYISLGLLFLTPILYFVPSIIENNAQ